MDDISSRDTIDKLQYSINDLMASTPLWESSRITADDQGAKVILAAALMLAYSTISVAIRLQTRWPWTQSYRKEDTVLLLAWVVSIGYTVSIALAVQNGFGLKASLVSNDKVYPINICLSVSFVLFFVTKGLGTASYSMFLEHLTEDDMFHRTVVRAGHVFSVVWIVPAIITTAIIAPRENSLPASSFPLPTNSFEHSLIAS